MPYSLYNIYSFLDMVYAFLLFWPANILSPWLFITLLQFYIPMNLFLKSFINKLQYNRIHFYSAFLILVGIALSLCGIINHSRTVSISRA